MFAYPVGPPTPERFSLTAAYAELHCHSAYSFLDGASRPEELATRAHELGYRALALTDHDNLCGALEFAHAAKALGVRPITGCELTVEDEHGPFHVTLLVETRTGYTNLSQLLSRAHARARLPHPPAAPARRPRSAPARPAHPAGRAVRARRGARLPDRVRTPGRARAPRRARRAGALPDALRGVRAGRPARRAAA